MPGDPATMNEDDAMERGTRIHRLLEYLPQVAPSERAAYGPRVLATHDPELVADVIRLLDQPDLAHLWDPAALSEIDITADIDGIGRIHGTIDRLIISDDVVLAVDYKSNQIVPDDVDQTPTGILRQMAAYHAALGKIYPDRTISVAILWTSSGKLVHVPVKLLHDTLIGMSVP